jgi:ATP-binding cassette subfamily C exporter for protease/lipase
MQDGGVQMFGPTKDVLTALNEANQKALAAQQAAQRAAAAGAQPGSETAAA